ncbi:family 20 glycosylhydrolase [Microbacterium excoecariae]|uniref:family 20 glycosylhydrolase n=1 Tax=Microbacterium excoecariae TaxID=2715210 RepID=UPI0014092A40|nr:family 20 glycosylhydrolase [Microbacterium excoecariae]NHI17611.1 family 20 glycosylhydrolase [Microbacterium excoecariae]
MPLPLAPWPRSVDLADGPALRVRADSAAAAIAALRPEVVTEAGHGDEGYALDVDVRGARIRCSAPAGAFYARRTLEQLAAPDGDGFALPAVRIRDRPRFAYRGLLLDVARHFLAPDTVEAVIARASALKLNALHLHLTDDQGWRIALENHPELARAGAASSVGGDRGGSYTAADYARIVECARAHHMIVVPEIDVPGHTHAVGLSHPELAAEPVISDEVRAVTAAYGGDLPAAGEPYTGLGVGFSSLDANAPGLGDFLDEVFADLAALTPGPYLHLGGDEALGTSAEDYHAMVTRAGEAVAATGKTAIAWHEAGRAALPPGSIGQYWGFRTPRDGHDDRARAFVARGGRVILSPADAIYLDMKPHADAPLGLVWADGPTSLERSYAWEPAGVIDGIAEDDILGVEACLWTETVRTLEDIDALAFPRIAAAAEAAWSAPAGTAGRSWDHFAPRARSLERLWRESGIAVEATS